MNKLKNKVFLTIFIILNIFGLSILTIYNFQSYDNEVKKVSNQLRNDNRFQPRNQNKENVLRFFDAKVYTAIIDNNNIISILSHSTDETISEEVYNKIEEITKNENGKYIGNLFFNNYSYKKTDNIIVLVDNSETNRILINNLKISVLLVISIIIVTYIISLKLSNWIIKPVEETFDKQKQFIADASHELKTPLAVIMASADTLEKDNNKKWIKNIQNESERMNKLIKNLLDLSKIENSKNFEEANISKIIEKSTITLESLMFEKNIKLHYKIDENIIFECNSDEIKQLMSILLDNAIKHSDNNGNIIVNLSKVKNEIILEVKNKGEKIPEGEEEKIFERFYRVDKSRNRNDNRYGLGLAIAKSIVLKHNGTIKAESKNNYTTFKIVFKKK